MKPKQIPATLDLTDRAKLAQHYFIYNPDRAQNYRPYFSMRIMFDPPFYRHSSWDFGDVTGRFVEGFIFNRTMVGDDEGKGVEQGVRNFMLSVFREDGLSYRGYVKDRDPKQEGDMFFWDQGRVLYGLVTWYVKEHTSLAIRVPDWVDKWDVRVTVDGADTPFHWQEDYARLDRVRRGQTVTVRYPLRRIWRREDVGTASFDFKWRGDTVVEVRPKGMILPLYERDTMDKDEVPFKSTPTRTAPKDFHIW
ncbi:MAG TPA: hypothetical protein EYP53_03475 [Candidatus Latescibacteria bacterium]|nr:hypothetical protein [Candidatus Latescibacterota bacterium]